MTDVHTAELLVLEHSSTITVSIYKKGDKLTAIIREEYHC